MRNRQLRESAAGAAAEMDTLGEALSSFIHYL